MHLVLIVPLLLMNPPGNDQQGSEFWIGLRVLSLYVPKHPAGFAVAECTLRRVSSAVRVHNVPAE